MIAPAKGKGKGKGKHKCLPLGDTSYCDCGVRAFILLQARSQAKNTAIKD